jgi:hypothetical protein
MTQEGHGRLILVVFYPSRPGRSGLSLLRDVGLELANHNKRDSEDIAKALEQPQAIVEHILMLFEGKGFIIVPSFTRRSGGRTQVIEIRPGLKRWLAETS